MNARTRSGWGPWWALRYWPGHLLVLVLVAVAVWLGSWQWDAWQARRDAEARDLTRVAPVPLAEVMGPDDPFPGDRVGQPVVLEGTWRDDGTVYVARGDGYWVVTPLDVGPGGAALPVVRGVSVEPSAPPVDGDAELVGWLQPPEGTGETDPDPSDDVLPQLRVADLVQRVDVDLYGGYAIVADEVAEGDGPVGERAVNPGTRGLAQALPQQLPESGRFTAARNLFYALEWWLFGGFAVFVWVRYLLDERGSESDHPTPAGAAGDDPIASDA
ncbi:SURF1 family protein [Nocardioides sp. GXQ0305]|uniref:SURF1 family protein n=1 Tax=Nocardioides sp. GXQ0305 TaxID=3423912 RepID=UPI003D7E21B5